MSDRWIPVLAAAVGVLGGMGGALIGGWIANTGQKQQFDAERRARTEDLRRETYVQYLQKVDALVVVINVKVPATELARRSEEIARAYAQAKSAQGQVQLVAPKPVRHAAERLIDTVETGEESVDESRYDRARSAFVTAARFQLTGDRS
jgi:hypothetical protein